jgi:hypothetical protein
VQSVSKQSVALRRRVFGFDARHFRTDLNHNLGIGRSPVTLVEHHMYGQQLTLKVVPFQESIHQFNLLTARAVVAIEYFHHHEQTAT